MSTFARALWQEARPKQWVKNVLVLAAPAATAWETIEAASWKNTKGETVDLWKEVMGRSFTVDKD